MRERGWQIAGFGLLLGALTAACQPPPEDACARLRYAWPFLQIDPSVDTSEEPGIQVTITLRSDLSPGTTAVLSLSQSEELDFLPVATTVAAADGAVTFEKVTVELGEAVFLVEAKDECGLHRSGIRTFVWDGQGFPECHLALTMEPEPGGVPTVLEEEHDVDPQTSGMQVDAVITSGRPDMEVRLFVTDRSGGDNDQEFRVDSGENGSVTQRLTLAEGEHAMRAVCIWEPEDLRPSSATRVYQVDLED